MRLHAGPDRVSAAETNKSSNIYEGGTFQVPGTVPRAREFSMRLSATVSAGLLLFSWSAICVDSGAALAILQGKCLTCHGESSAMSGLVLTTRESLLKGGSRGPAIVPGKAAESLLFKAVAGSGEVLRMPPVGGGLPAADIALIKEWIDA